MSVNGAIQLVVFDLDDTLYAERDYVRSGYRAVGAHLRRRLSTRRLFERWLWRRFVDGKSAGAFDAMNAYFRLGLDKAGIDELVGVYRQHAPEIRPFRNIPRLLERIAASRRVALLSDGFLPAQRLKLEALGVSQWFAGTVFTEELGRDAWKPSPRGFEMLAAQLGVPAGACAYVADNPAKDFVAPNALGWLSVQYLRADQLHAARPAPEGGQPKAQVRSARELCRALGLR